MKNELTSVDFNIEIDGNAIVTRNLKYKNGNSISFSVSLARNDADTLPDIHRKSVERVIELLREFIEPK